MKGCDFVKKAVSCKAKSHPLVYKNSWMAAAILLVLTVISTRMVCSLYARYTISDTGRESAGTAAAAGLALEEISVELYSDSKYVIDALEKGWAWGWKKKGWIKSDKKPALNPDLWEVLLGLTQKHELHYHWVKGHADNPKNNRCDQLAVAQCKQIKGEL